MAAEDPDRGIFIQDKMSDFNTSEETGKVSSENSLPLNLRLYVPK